MHMYIFRATNSVGPTHIFLLIAEKGRGTGPPFWYSSLGICLLFLLDQVSSGQRQATISRQVTQPKKKTFEEPL